MSIAPSSPSKLDLRPNPHPYAIKTTSTGVLSRSNSSPHNPQPTRSHYLPPPPSPSPSPTSPRCAPGQGHKYSKSLSSDGPSALPIPPSSPFPSPTQDPQSSPKPNEVTPRNRLRRADTLPSESSTFPPSSPSHIHVPPLAVLDDLPSNPKSWTPSQLSAYLSTVLRVKSGETLPLPHPVARDITQFVRESSITGKMFLRFNDVDLEKMGINKLWRTALLSSSRNLRENVLRGRIWGFGYSVDDNDDNAQQGAPFSTHADRVPKGARYPGPMGGNENDSGEVDEAHVFPSDPYSSSSSTSSVDFPSSSSAPAVSALRRLRHGGGNFRNGRVKGMVENFERTRSESTGSESGGSKRTRSGSGSSIGVGGDLPNGILAGNDVGQREEPTMEALLRNEKGTWGARAWEEDTGLGETVKRVVGDHGDSNTDGESGCKEAEMLSAAVAEGENRDGVLSHEMGEEVKEGGDTRSWRTRGGRGKGKRERQAVTAIFASHVNKREEAIQPCESAQEEGVREEETARLMDELGETRALVESFRRRLEVVERRVEEMKTNDRAQRCEEPAQNVVDKYDNEETIQEQRKQRSRFSLSLLFRPYTLLSSLIHTIPPPSPSSLPTFTTQSPPASPIRNPRTDQTTAIDTDANKGALYRALHPMTISALPSYILLVSIGVCAVVFRVVRRAFGRRRG